MCKAKVLISAALILVISLTCSWIVTVKAEGGFADDDRAMTTEEKDAYWKKYGRKGGKGGIDRKKTKAFLDQNRQDRVRQTSLFLPAHFLVYRHLIIFSHF